MERAPGGDEAVPTAEGTTEARRSGPHIAGLDGIRAVAVIGVLGFHAGVAGFAGGLLGVDIFFVLSGFLITSLLVAEWSRTGHRVVPPLLRAAGPAPPPRPLPAPAAGGRLRPVVRRARHAEHAARRCLLHVGLRRQLAVHLLGTELLRALRAAVAAAAHLVVGGRGAVLPGLAGRGPVRPAPEGPAGPGRRGRGGHGPLGHPDRLPVQRRRQHLPPLLRHRHPRPGGDGGRAAGRGRTGHRPPGAGRRGRGAWWCPAGSVPCSSSGRSTR